ncbi:MAG: hypothetical protein KGY99_03860 [Phycisphaerae bacterium]|nr:hypothetical protein [Phycisphaerae bacterium]
MAMVAGIDEAGYGPVLGPLVITAVAFEVPDDRAEASLWDPLGSAVARKRSCRDGRIAIADSKKLYSRRASNPLEHLERATLSATACLADTPPASFADLLSVLAPAAGDAVGAYPWYAGQSLALPQAISPTGRALAANALAAAMRRSGVHLRLVRCEPVLVGEFNRMVAATDNKTATLLSVTGRLLAQLAQSAPVGRTTIHVDRQGGRRRYLSFLQNLFPRAAMKIVDESDTRSVYRVTNAQRLMEVSFAVSADAAQLPTALASMVSKYVRELFMQLFNGFWTARSPGLAPTAGYYVDGRRFYEAIAPSMRRFGIDDGLVYRRR